MPDSLLTLVAEAIPIAAGVIYVLLNRRARYRLRNARLAKMLLEEITSHRPPLEQIIGDTIKMEKVSQEPGQYDHMGGNYEHLFQRSVYDGLVSSSRLVHFDSRIRKKLHEVYYRTQWFGRYSIAEERHAGVTGTVVEDKAGAEALLRSVDETIQVVEKFRDRNQYRGRWFPVLKAVALEYAD